MKETLQGATCGHGGCGKLEGTTLGALPFFFLRTGHIKARTIFEKNQQIGANDCLWYLNHCDGDSRCWITSKPRQAARLPERANIHIKQRNRLKTCVRSQVFFDMRTGCLQHQSHC